MDLDLLEEILESSDTNSEFSMFDTSLSSSLSSSSDSEPEAEEGVDVNGFEETIRNYTERAFKDHFRLNRSTAYRLIEIFENYENIVNRQSGGRSAEKQIYIFLWYVANTDTLRELANLFNISPSTVWNIVVRVSSWLVTIGHEYIRWPSAEEIPQITSRNELEKNIRGVIGAIDCTHIAIVAPGENKEVYFNRKSYYSVHLQAIVGLDKRFYDVSVGDPGSFHDSRVLRKSELYAEAMNGTDRLFPGNTFILGDSAYPLMDWLIPPYRDNNRLTSEQRQFNCLHSSARISVEHSFRLLKTRFRRLLHFTENDELNFILNLTIATCVLHNMCIGANDVLEEEPAQGSEETEYVTDNPLVSDNSAVPGNRRDLLLSELISNNIISV